MNRIRYKAGYKYQLTENYRIGTAIRSPNTIKTDHISIWADGTLSIKQGYAWDGPSGPTWDTSCFMRGSLVHDALYQLIRQDHLHESWRQYADELLRTTCREDGMSAIRAWWVYRAVRMFGASAANPKNERKILTAP